MKLTVRKYDPSDPSRCSFDEARSLYSSTTYDISVYADDFTGDQESACTVKLLRRAEEDDAGLTEYASASLIADPYRRNRRYGTLVVNDSPHSSLFDALAADGAANTMDDFILSVTLGSSSTQVIYAKCPVVIAPRAVQGSSGGGGTGVSATSDLWTSVDLGTLTVAANTVTDPWGLAFAVPLADRSATKCFIDLTGLTGTKNFIIVPTKADGVTPFTGDFFEASIVVRILDDAGSTNEGSWSSSGTAGLSGSRLKYIWRGTAVPPQSGIAFTEPFVWDYDDSREMASSTDRFIIKVSRLPYDGQWHAEFRVANAAPVGVEIDPTQGVAVPGADVNG